MKEWNLIWKEDPSESPSPAIGCPVDPVLSFLHLLFFPHLLQKARVFAFSPHVGIKWGDYILKYFEELKDKSEKEKQWQSLGCVCACVCIFRC